MKSNIALTGIILFLINYSGFSTTVNGRFVDKGLIGSKHNILLQINTDTGIDDLGGATIVFSYDTNAIRMTNTPIKNADYTFHNFDGGQYSSATITKPMKNKIWVNIDLPFTHNNNGTVVAGSPGWTNVVTIKFDVVDINRPLGLSWFLTSFFWGIYDANNMTLWETGAFEGNFGLSVHVNNGWNTVSVPGINPAGQNVNVWWPGRDTNSDVYKMFGNYFSVTNTSPGEGYWMKHIGNNEYNTGDEWPVGGIQVVPHNPINAAAGWNIVGGYENRISVADLTTTPPGLIVGPIYSYSNQFNITSTLEPGYGYFVRMSAAGTINYPGVLTNSTDNNNYFNDDWGKLLFTDASGRNFTLYLTDENLDFNLYELPPSPPDNSFDIRFASGRIVENTIDALQTIILNGVNYPLQLNVENISITLIIDSFGKNGAELKPGQGIVINNESVNKLMILIDKSENLNTYSLEQNYPNPFNPTTTIRLAIPFESDVNLSVYNVLGELIAVLVDSKMTPGQYEYQFDSANLASGVYLYALRANDLTSSSGKSFTQIKKMILIK